MEELRELIQKIRQVLGVKPGDKAMVSEEAGDAGQMLDDLIYDNNGSAWKSLEDTDRRDLKWHQKQHPEEEYDKKQALSYRVAQAAQYYLNYLQGERAS